MSRDHRPAKPWRSRFAVALCLSLLLHALLLALPTRFDARHDAPRPTPAVHTLRLRLTAARDPGRSATPAKPPAMTPQQGRRSPQPTLVGRLPTSVAGVVPVEPAAQPVPTQTIDLDALRAQARDLARHPAEPRTQLGGERPTPQQDAPDLLDRPSLESVARRIGQPPRGASERRLADGSRMIRFAGNVCLRIPAQLPLGQENPFGPTVLVPTNCPD